MDYSLPIIEKLEKKPVHDLSRQRAAQAWCTPTTSHIQMDPALAEAFAEILEEIWTQPWLGNATTEQLLDEVKARVPLHYRTVDPV